MNTTIKMLHFLIAFYQEVFDDDMTHFTGGFKLDCLTWGGGQVSALYSYYFPFLVSAVFWGNPGTVRVSCFLILSSPTNLSIIDGSFLECLLL